MSAEETDAFTVLKFTFLFISFNLFSLALCHTHLERCTAAGHYKRPPFQACSVQPFIILCSYISHEAPLSVRGHLGGVRAKTQPVLLTLKIEVTAALHAPLGAQTRGPTEKYIDFGTQDQPLRLW